MNSDATEAALGLLGLSPFNAPQSHPPPPPPPPPPPHPHHHVAHAHGPTLTSSSVGIAIDRTNAPHIVPPSLVPLKRKQPSPALPTTSTSIPHPTSTPITPSSSKDNVSVKPRQPSHPLATSSTPPIKSTRPLPNNGPTKSSIPSQRHPQQLSFSPSPSTSLPPQTPPASQIQLASPSTSQQPLALPDVQPPPDSDAIACICGFTFDDGFSIACDDCSRWCHAACFGIVQGGEVPEFWKCWVCDPTVEVDKERAVKIQKGRLKAMRMKAWQGVNGVVPAGAGVNGLGGNSSLEEGSGTGKPMSRRKASPGAERKPKRGSNVAASIEGSGSKKKRRASIAPQDPSLTSPIGPPSPLPPGSSTQPHMSHAGSSRTSHPNGYGCVASSSHATQPTPVAFPADFYPNPAIYAQLLGVAKAWRGVTALNPPSPLVYPPPKAFHDGGYARVESQRYSDRYGYSMSPLDNTTPVILDEHAGDFFLPRTVLRSDPSTSYTLAHLRPPSPRLHVAPDPTPFSHTTTYPYPSPPISNYMSPTVPSSSSSSSHSRPYTKSPLAPSTNTAPSLSNAHHETGTTTIPASTLLAPYTATIVPSVAYLADPLNGYAHLGMGKPQVRLVGGGWGVGLDARGGGEPSLESEMRPNGVEGGKEEGRDANANTNANGRWARCGCWPNAVVRPVICRGTKRSESKKGRGKRHKADCSTVTTADGGVDPHSNSRSVSGDSTSASSSLPKTTARGTRQMDDSSDQDDPTSMSESDADPTTLSFALFALRDLRADEEIVLGWEWDDGHAVHMLPALMESPGMFGSAHLQHLRAQFTSILHALSSTFTTCACGSSTRDCAVRVMERVVEGRWPWPGREMTPEGSEEDEDSPEEADVASEEWGDVNGDGDGDVDVDVEGDGDTFGPRARHRQRQRQRQPNRGLGVVDVDVGPDVGVDIEMDGSMMVDEDDGRARRKVRKKRKVRDGGDPKSASTSTSTSGLKSKSNLKKVPDLGPLVGVKRGFRTREKAPMSGGWCGVEVVPSSLAAFPEVGKEDGYGHGGNKGKGKEKAMEADGPGVADGMQVDSSISALPPRMRMAWTKHLDKASDPPQSDHQNRADARGRWRSPPDTHADSPSSAYGTAEGSTRRTSASKQGASVGLNGDGEDGADGHDTEFDTETEADGVDDTLQMPPPPMPAALDPTTVSSRPHAHGGRSSSPRGSVQWERNGASTNWPPPRTPTPTSATPLRSSQLIGPGVPPATPLPQVSSQVQHHNPLSNTSVPAASIPPHTPLVPSVSPSAPFSKLSLHSPDASTSQTSALFSPCDSTMFSPVSSASSQRTSHHQRAASPAPHRPSKPLHVHPQNESPTLSSSALVAPGVTIRSPDGTRDTPAEAQYQRPYRASPDSRPAPDSDINAPAASESLDAEKKRAVGSGEVHRVRFASPEVLRGLPRLSGREKLESVAAADVDVDMDVGGRGRGVGDVKEAGKQVQEVKTTDSEEMAVDVDVALSTLEKNGMDTMDELTPRSQPPPSTGPSPSAETAATCDNESSSLSSEPQHPVSEAPTSDSMGTEPEPTQQQPPPREPSPPPLPKVKMSLKDFALRKKKQREEEMAAKALASPATPESSVLPPSPSIDFSKRELNPGDNTTLAQNGHSHDVEMQDVTKGHVQHPEDTPAPRVNAIEMKVDRDRNGDDTVVRNVEENGMAVEGVKATLQHQVSAVPELTPVSEVMKTSPPPPRSSSPPLRVSKGNDSTPTTLTAKIEVMESVVPKDYYDGDPNDVIPDPEPSLLTAEASERSLVSVPVSVPALSLSTPPSTSSSTSTSTSAVHSRANSIGISASAALSNPAAPPHAHVSTALANIPSSRKASHEDGEIPSSTSSKTYLPLSHTPPTQPRSFHAVHPQSPNVGPTQVSSAPVPRRPAPPLSRSPLSNAPGPAPTSIASRPLPSGPRALRGSMAQPTHPAPYASARPPYAGSQYIPRGPSADRERDWDRDRQWAASSRSRGRAGSNGWGR